LHEPAGWRASVGTGLGLGLPVAVLVLLFAGVVAEGMFSAVIVWLLVVPPLAAVVAAATGLAVDRLGWPMCRWWWAVALAPGLAVVVFVGTLLGGPSGSTPERAAGWATVVPVISGYRPVAARSDVRTLQIDMAGPIRLVVWIDRCGDGCVARDVTAVGTRTFVAGGSELTVIQADGAIDVLTTLPGLDVRATSHRELARLPLAPSYRSYD
jgi:hypothetical protein